jgi:hypothetical protein
VSAARQNPNRFHRHAVNRAPRPPPHGIRRAGRLLWLGFRVSSPSTWSEAARPLRAYSEVRAHLAGGETRRRKPGLISSGALDEVRRIQLGVSLPPASPAARPYRRPRLAFARGQKPVARAHLRPSERSQDCCHARGSRLGPGFTRLTSQVVKLSISSPPHQANAERELPSGKSRCLNAEGIGHIRCRENGQSCLNN